MKENNGYSVMHINVIGTNASGDKRRQFASHWCYASAGIYIAIMIMKILDIRYPAILGAPLITVSFAGILITQCWDLFRRFPMNLKCGNTHLPILVNYMNKNIRCDLLREQGMHPLQVFKSKYRCEEIRQDGRKAYRLTGVPSEEIVAFIKANGPAVGVFVFFISRINLVYVCNSEGEDQIGDVLGNFSAERTLHIEVDF